jgi:hypothetical protein
MIHALYDNETRGKNLSWELRQELQQRESIEVLRAIENWLDGALLAMIVPTTDIAKAGKRPAVYVVAVHCILTALGIYQVHFRRHIDGEKSMSEPVRTGKVEDRVARQPVTTNPPAGDEGTKQTEVHVRVTATGRCPEVHREADLLKELGEEAGRREVNAQVNYKMRK